MLVSSLCKVGNVASSVKVVTHSELLPLTVRNLGPFLSQSPFMKFHFLHFVILNIFTTWIINKFQDCFGFSMTGMVCRVYSWLYPERSTPGRALGAIWGARDQTKICHVLGKCFIHLTCLFWPPKNVFEYQLCRRLHRALVLQCSKYTVLLRYLERNNIYFEYITFWKDLLMKWHLIELNRVWIMWEAGNFRCWKQVLCGSWRKRIWGSH